MKLIKLIAAAFAVVMTLLAAGCGGGGGSPGSNPSQKALTTTAPEILSLQVGSTARYEVSGGVPPYRVGNSQASVANATINGTKLDIAALIVGRAAVDIIDYSGAKITVAVTVGGTLVINAPDNVTLMPGSVVRYQIAGGIKPYRVTNPNSQIATANVVNGNTLEISAIALGSVSLAVSDGAGGKVEIAVTVAASVPLRTTAPSPVALLPGSGAQYDIAGGVAPYRAISSDTQVATVTVEGGRLQINGQAAGTTTVTVQDMVGTKVEVTVKVGSNVTLTTTAPSPVILTPGVTGRYEISGGARPYRVGNSNVAVAVGEITGNVLSIRAVAAGDAKVDVIDNAGNKVSIDVKVPSAPSQPLSVTAPSPVTLFPGSSAQYDILGGAAPYRASSSNTQVANASVDGTRLLISAVAAGTAVINVVDNVGNRISVNVTVGSSAPLTTSAPATLTIGVGPSSVRTFSIQGGVAPYTVQGSNQNVFTVARNGNEFSVTGIAIGTGTITVTDAANTRVSIAVTVGAPELRVSPTDLKIFPGIDAEVVISGGQPPYRVAGGIPAAIQVTISGDVMRIKGLLASKLDVTVADATGQTAKVTVEVANGTGQFNIMPGALSITEDDNQDIRLNIYGAAPGPVCFYTDRTQLQPREAGCPSNPQTVTLVTGSAGSRCVNGNTNVTLTAVDVTGAVATAVVTIVDNGGCAAQPPQPLTSSATTATVTTAPAGGGGGAATSTQLLVFGGSGQYGVTSSNSGAATATIAGSVLTITGGTTPGTATVTVFDQQRPTSSVSINVTAN